MAETKLNRRDAAQLLDLAARYRQRVNGETYADALKGITATRPHLVAAWQGQHDLTTGEAKEILGQIK